MRGRAEVTFDTCFNDLSELLKDIDPEELEKDTELRKRLMSVLEFKFGFNKEMLKNIVDEFRSKEANYSRIYEACDEQMECIDEMKLAK